MFCYFKSKAAGFKVTGVPLITTYTSYLPAPDSELVARLYIYLQSTIRKLLLLSCGWMLVGSFTGPEVDVLTFVTWMVACYVGQVAVGEVDGCGVNVSVYPAVPNVALVSVRRWSPPQPASSTSDARTIGIFPTNATAPA